jgi:hypothetical protein
MVKETAMTMLNALPDNSEQATVLNACGYIASSIIRKQSTLIRRDLVEDFVDEIYAHALDLKRREKA